MSYTMYKKKVNQRVNKDSVVNNYGRMLTQMCKNLDNYKGNFTQNLSSLNVTPLLERFRPFQIKRTQNWMI